MNHLVIAGPLEPVLDTAPREKYVPLAEQRKDPRYHIFKRRWMVRVPRLHMQTEEEIRTFGTPYTGDSDHDRSMQNEQINCMKTINDLLELFRKGVQFTIVDTVNTKAMHEVIQNYLAAWRREMEVGMYFTHVPREDLMDLDSLDRAIYQHARYFFQPGEIDDIISKRLGSILPDVMGLMNAAPKVVSYDAKVPEVDPDERFPKRMDFQEVFDLSPLASNTRWSI